MFCLQVEKNQQLMDQANMVFHKFLGRLNLKMMNKMKLQHHKDQQLMTTSKVLYLLLIRL